VPAPSSLSRLLRATASAVLRSLRTRPTSPRPSGASAPRRDGAATTTTARPRAPRAGTAGTPVAGRTVLPDHRGPVPTEYSPEMHDGAADPGEIVWTWVPYEEDPTQGKDRPVLVVGWDGPVALGLMLTSKDHDRNAAREARKGRVWMDIGSGPWDSRRRDSEVRLDRVLRLDPDTIRREGAVVDHDLFVRVTTALAELRRRA